MSSFADCFVVPTVLVRTTWLLTGVAVVSFLWCFLLCHCRTPRLIRKQTSAMKVMSACGDGFRENFARTLAAQVGTYLLMKF